jgi:hypothetical protein
LSDTDLRFVQDSTINQVALANIEYPTLGMEHNADRASTLRRVLDADPKSENYQKAINTSLRLYYKRK